MSAKPSQSTHDRAVSANRLELLLFKLDGGQLFGINVLKVKEIIACPPLTQIPKSSSVVRGVAELRGHTIPVVDLSLAIGRRGLENFNADREAHKVIVAEFNRTTQGFVVSGVERIIIRDWKDVLPPPRGATGSYITGVIRMDDALVQIIDVERVLGEVNPGSEENAASEALDERLHSFMQNRQVLLVDDSSIARTQTSRTLKELDIPYTTAKDGREALEIIQAMSETKPLIEQVPMIISDIEMPEMDGYQLTREIRANPRCEGVYVLLHTSLDGQVNSDKAHQAGADATLTKFVPELLAKEIRHGLEQIVDNA